MNTLARVLAFVVGLAVVFTAAFAVGRLVDPDTAPVAAHRSTAGHDTAGHDAAGHDGEGRDAAPAAVRLALGARSLPPGADVPVSFQVQDDDGRAITSYDVEHQKELHLIVLDTRSLTDYQHVHPTRATDGTWVAHLRLQPGTSYRMYADGSTGGAGFVATADLWTTGHHPAPDAVPDQSTTARVAGMTVRLDEADGLARLAVTRDGHAVTLEPYLGALGHLVAIRVDDLSYLHVHPEEGGVPQFMVSGLAPGRYRYFFDFKVDGVVRTAAFTHVVRPVSSADGMPMGTEDPDHDEH